MNRVYWTTAVLLLFFAAGRLWLLAAAHDRYAPFRDSHELVAVRSQVQELLATRDSQQLEDVGFTMEPSSMRDLPSPLAQRAAWLADAGVTQIRFQRFDPEAVVIVRPGKDQQPGVAGVDDGANGIVDDVSELGATGSDDICRALPAAEAVSEPGQPTLILERGAYIAATFADAAGGPYLSRAIVVGQSSDGQPWSFMVRMTNVQ